MINMSIQCSIELTPLDGCTGVTDTIKNANLMAGSESMQTEVIIVNKNKKDGD